MQPLPIPDWKWEIVSIDFTIALPKNQNKNYYMMVAVENVSNAAHFIPVKTTYKAANIVDIFMKEVFRLHGIPKMIFFYRDPKFASNFWNSLFLKNWTIN